jgi:hypothetical protein
MIELLRISLVRLQAAWWGCTLSLLLDRFSFPQDITLPPEMQTLL